jgi:hypothetical protein
MGEVADEDNTRRANIFAGDRVGLSVMQAQDVPSFARWEPGSGLHRKTGRSRRGAYA